MELDIEDLTALAKFLEGIKVATKNSGIDIDTMDGLDLLGGHGEVIAQLVFTDSGTYAVEQMR